MEKLFLSGRIGMKESDVVKSIKLNLKLFCPEVVHVDRLNSGMAQKGKYWIKLCKEGTPDLYAIVKHNGGKLIFIETKSPDGGYQSQDQKKFEDMLKGLDNVHYILVSSLSEVIKYIEKEVLDKSDII
jgi:hypothetical protein